MTALTPGVTIRPTGEKTFIPLENNPTVFRDLIVRLGVSPKLDFYDVYDINEPALTALIPRPAHALIFISPADVYHRRRAQDSAPKGTAYDGCGREEPVMWYKQTIGHACGLIALLHSISNGTARQFVQPGSLIDRLIQQGLPLKPQARADVLYNSRELEEAHMASAVKGDTAAPSSREPCGYHFIAFVKGTNGHLYELEGSSKGPIDRGDLSGEDDMLSERALGLGIRKYLEVAQDNLEFSIVALSTSDDE